MVLALPAWMAGTGLSVVSCLVIIFTYFRFRSFRVHPNNLVVLRTFLDLGFCMLLFQLPARQSISIPSLEISNSEVFKNDTSCDGSGPKVLSFFGQVTALGSELCFLVICADLTISVRNPFTNFSANTLRYRYFIFLVSTISGFLLIFIPNAAGLSTLGICWTRAFDQGFNEYSWGFFFIPIILIYVFCVFSLVFTTQRLRSGLPEVFKLHEKVIVANRRYVVAYCIYWTIAAALYATMYWLGLNFVFIPEGKTPPPGLQEIFAFVLGGKTCVTAVVWWLNMREEGWKNLDRDTERKITSDLNQVLRSEVLRYTTEGIRASVAVADRQRSKRESSTFFRLQKGGYISTEDNLVISFHPKNNLLSVEEKSAANIARIGRNSPFRHLQNNNNNNGNNDEVMEEGGINGSSHGKNSHHDVSLHAPLITDK